MPTSRRITREESTPGAAWPEGAVLYEVSYLGPGGAPAEEGEHSWSVGSYLDAEGESVREVWGRDGPGSSKPPPPPCEFCRHTGGHELSPEETAALADFPPVASLDRPAVLCRPCFDHISRALRRP